MPGNLRQRRFAVVPERRMTEVMREACRLHDVGVTAEGRTQIPTDLRAFQRMREPSTREIALDIGGTDHLSFGAKPPQRETVQHPGPVPGERRAGGVLRRYVGHSLRLSTTADNTGGQRNTAACSRPQGRTGRRQHGGRRNSAAPTPTRAAAVSATQPGATGGW